MAQEADSGSKKLISLDPTAWVRWATGLPDITASRPLDHEFQWVTRRADSLVPAHSPSLGDFLVATEFTLRYNDQAPERMAAYCSLAREKYRLPVFPILMVLLPPADEREIPDRFESEFLGKRSLVEYGVVRLWEMDVAPVFETPIPTLLPYVPLMKSGADEKILRRAAAAIQAYEDQPELEAALATFALYAFDPQVVGQIVRCDMLALRVNPVEEEIKKIARRETTHDLLARLLRQKFGDAVEPAISRIMDIDDLEYLDTIADKILTATTIDDLGL